MAEAPGLPGREAAGVPGKTGERSGGRGPLWLLIPLAVSIAVLVVLGPDVVFLATVPARTDLPGHLLPQTLLAERLLPAGRTHGWSLEWFGGFPLYWFYFPLPGWLAAALALPFGPVVALRIVALAPALALPWALDRMGRWSRLGHRTTAAIVVVGSSFLLTTHDYLLGGNLLSLLTGEFAYGWGLLFAVLYVGTLARKRERWADGVLPGVLLAAAVLSHVVPAIAVGLASLGLLVAPGGRRKPTLASWGVAGLLTSFWTLPLAANLGEVAHLEWIFDAGPRDALPGEVALLLPAALAGAAVLRRGAGPLLLVAAGLAGLALTWTPQTFVMQGRALPVWFLAVHVAAGGGVGRLWVEASDTSGARGRRGRALALLTVLGGIWLVVVGVRGFGTVRSFSRSVLAGLPARPGADELAGLVFRLRDLPPGRVHWEDGDGLDRWGGPHALALLPWWTGHPTLHGLLAESSPMSESLPALDAMLSFDPRERPFRPAPPAGRWDPPAAVRALRLLGVRYVVTITPETGAALATLSGVGREGGWGDMELFDLGAGPMVSALPCPVKPTTVDTLRAQRGGWPYEAGRDPAGPAAWLVAGLTSEQAGACFRSGPATATDIEVEAERVRFRATAVGVPQLVRVSYFPAWRAVGAEGPFPAAPWFMVVVPRQEEVTLVFRRTPAEWAGSGLSLAGLALAVGLIGAGRGRAGRKLNGRWPPSPAGPPGARP